MKSVAVLALPLVLSAGIYLSSGTCAVADPRLMAYGKHLSQECTTCHRRDGTSSAIPSIIGLEVDYFVDTIKFYQNGTRDNPAMVSVAKALNEEQLKALALYFGSLTPAPKAATAPAKKK